MPEGEAQETCLKKRFQEEASVARVFGKVSMVEARERAIFGRLSANLYLTPP